jgi:hypothetical protein
MAPAKSLSPDRILTLKVPYDGLTRAVNVLDTVGFSEGNKRDDVLVVQNLLRILTMTKAFASSVGLPQATGSYDALTGFWIYNWQYLWSSTIDGTVSPARGDGYYGGKPWFIIQLNAAARRANSTGWERYINQI